MPENVIKSSAETFPQSYMGIISQHLYMIYIAHSLHKLQQAKKNTDIRIKHVSAFMNNPLRQRETLLHYYTVNLLCWEEISFPALLNFILVSTKKDCFKYRLQVQMSRASAINCCQQSSKYEKWNWWMPWLNRLLSVTSCELAAHHTTLTPFYSLNFFEAW